MSTAPRLSADLVALLHHIELNRDGWWDQALQQLVLAALWLSDVPLDAGEIANTLRGSFGVNQPDDQISTQIATLAGKGEIVRLPHDRYKISEAQLASLASRLKEDKAVETAARGVFYRLAHCHLASMANATAWRGFKTGLLRPLMHQAGAYTYQLLSGQAQSTNVSPVFRNYINNFGPESQEAVARIVEGFFAPTCAETRSYVLRMLNAHFYLQSSSLSQETVKTLQQLTAKKPSFRLFLDTNVLLVLLGLDPKYGDQIPRAFEAISSLKDSVEVTVYVFPETVDEATRVLSAVRNEMQRLRLTPKILDICLSLPHSGVALQYLLECKRIGRQVDPETYFGPYLNHFTQVIRGKGIKLYNADFRHRRMIPTSEARTLFDTIHSRLDYPSRAQEHDFRIWQSVAGLRPESARVAVEAESWIVTLDRTLLEYDDTYWKQRSIKGSLPLCVHPTTLFHVLELWIPRTAELEDAILGALGPLLSRNFDPASERVTVRILEALSRYEDIEDLSVDTIRGILYDEALRQRLSGPTSIVGDGALVQNALVQQQKETEKRLALVNGEVQQLKGELETFRASAAESAQTASRVERSLFFHRLVAIPAGIAALVLTHLMFLMVWRDWSAWICVSIMGCYLWTWAYFIRRIGAKQASVSQTALYKKFCRSQTWLSGVIWAIILGATGNWVYDVFRRR